jgi:AcrR family transcriptional regulator
VAGRLDPHDRTQLTVRRDEVRLGPILEPEFHFSKLRPGPGLPAETVLADQRRRLHGAILRMITAGGWGEVRVRALIQTAGVSTSTFYKQFANTDECLASALDASIADLLRDFETGPHSEADWRDSVRCTLRELADRFASNQEAARVALIDSFAAGPSARKRAGTMAARLEDVVSACFSRSAARPAVVPRHLIAGMTGGVLRVVRATVAAGRAAELPRLADPLADWLLSFPSEELLTLPSAEATRPADKVAANPLSRLGGSPADSRRRLLQTVMRLASRDGFDALTAPALRRDAGVSRRHFDQLFRGVDDCFLSGIEAVVESTATGANRSLTAKNWTRRTHRSIAALCAEAADNRRLARVTFLEIFAAGRDGLLQREKIIGSAATALRRTIPPEERPSRLVSEASVAAAWHVAQADVVAGRTRNLPDVAPLLSYLVMAPIVGVRPAISAIRAEAAERTPA